MEAWWWSNVCGLIRLQYGWCKATFRKLDMNRFSADLARYRSKGYRGKELWFDPALWAIGCYRLGNWLHVTRPFILVRLPLKVVSYFANKWCEVFMEMCIDVQATIGPGLYIGHIGGVHINPQAVLGKNCDLAHRVTIGASSMGREGAPVLGDEVYIGTGATLIGRIKVGSGAKIAANTLVISNIPAGATVMGVPGRIIMRPPKAVEPVAVAAAETTNAE
jgi:serine O-acetyltransferase